jgi:hypothetical protein
METFNYNNPFINNPKLRGRCIGFSYMGCVLLKKLFKENNMECKVQVKRYVINNDDDNFSPYHYYIEVKTPTGKMIIDNEDNYNYKWYMNRYNPRGTIEKIGYRVISKEVNNNSIDIENEIENTIRFHFENIKRFYKK